MPDGFPRGGEYGRRTPVESREKRDAGVTNDVVVPALLALAATVSVGALWLACLVLLRAVEAHVYWLTVVVGCGAIVLAPILTHWRHRDDATIITVVAGGLLTVTCGWLATALWRLTRDLTWSQLLTTVPVVSLPVGVAWLMIATFQESFFRSPFVEQAIGLLISGENAPWWEGRQPPEVVEPESVTVRWSDTRNGHVSHWQRLDFPLEADDAKWLAGHILGGGNLSIPQCSGSGKPLSRSNVQSIQHWLINGGFGGWRDEDEHAKGFAVNAKGRALFRGLREQL